MLFFFFFFFSSRRRHTRSLCDWSSDVCSSDLFPFSLYEQAPFVAHGIPAITLTSAGSRPPDPFSDRRVRTRSLGAVGAATQELLGSLDQGLELAQGTTSYVFLGDRLIRGWALQIALA